jgi:hypothetical protein
MALKKTVTTPHGFNAVEAYHRVEGVQISKDIIIFQFRSYKDKSSLPHFADVQVSCAYNIEGDNPIKQAYMHIKALPEFADAVDC